MNAPIFMLLLLIGFISLKADQVTEDTYLRIYVKLHDAENMEKAHDYFEALIVDKVSMAWLYQSYKWDPTWERALLLKRVKELEVKIAELRPLAAKQYSAAHKSPLIEDSDVSNLYEEGLRLKKKHPDWNALDRFATYQTILEIIQIENPTWEPATVEQKLKDVQVQIDQTAKSIVQEGLKN